MELMAVRRPWTRLREMDEGIILETVEAMTMNKGKVIVSRLRPTPGANGRLGARFQMEIVDVLLMTIGGNMTGLGLELTVG